MLAMSNYSSLERVVDKVISQVKNDLISKIDHTYNEALSRLRSSKDLLEREYNKIIEEANKQALNLKRQIIGSASINARNKQLLIVEDGVNKIFEEVKKRIDSIRDTPQYIDLLTSLLEDAINTINKDMIIECNKEDREMISTILPKLSYPFNIMIKDEPIDILGGLRAYSVDGSIIYESTLDKRIERLKPLIKRDIVGLFTR